MEQMGDVTVLRKKKEPVEEFKYCAMMRCKNLNCLRHYKNAPFDVEIKLSHMFGPNKKGICNGFVEVFND